MKNSHPGQAAAAGNTYSPSVPISVYRDLAAELQATKAMLESVTTQNQQLSRQNKQLRHEIDAVVQAAMNLRQTADSLDPTRKHAAEAKASAEITAELSRIQAARATAQRPPQPAQPMMGDTLPGAYPTGNETLLSDELFTEQDDRPYPANESTSSRPKDLGGIWLTITIVTIIVTGLGAGFLAVRPLLPNNNQK